MRLEDRVTDFVVSTRDLHSILTIITVIIITILYVFRVDNVVLKGSSFVVLSSIIILLFIYRSCIIHGPWFDPEKVHD